MPHYELAFAGALTKLRLDFRWEILQQFRREIRYKLCWEFHHLRTSVFIFSVSAIFSLVNWIVSSGFLR